jgi:predicted nuclease of predicted toxin-antitoxin system
MKLLLDQGTPRRTAEWLRQSGWDAVHTGEEGFSAVDEL